jgi:TRAP-type C4-dicarboxylate transport system permease small subunit
MNTAMRVIVDLFAAGVCAVVAYHAARFVLMERSFGSIAFASVPTWICELILPLAFGIIALRYFTFFLINIRTILTGATSE